MPAVYLAATIEGSILQHVSLIGEEIVLARYDMYGFTARWLDVICRKGGSLAHMTVTNGFWATHRELQPLNFCSAVALTAVFLCIKLKNRDAGQAMSTNPARREEFASIQFVAAAAQEIGIKSTLTNTKTLSNFPLP